MFNKPSKVSIGLDIGSYSIKAVQLKRLKDACELVAYAIEPIQDGAGPGSGAPPAVGSQTASLKKLFDKGFFVTDKVRISVSGPKVISRYVPFPRMTEQELKEALKFEAERYIPFKADEIVLDYIYDPSDIKNDKLFVMLIAAKKDLVNEKIALVTDAGLKVEAVDIDPFCIVNTYLFSNPKPDANVAFLNIGESISNIVLVSGNRVHLVRDVEIGGTKMVEALSKIFAITSEDARKLLVSPADKEADIFSGIKGPLEALSGELRVSFDYFESQFERTVDKLYLTGGISRFKTITGQLKERFGIEVLGWDPAASVSIGSSIDKDKLIQVSGELAVAIGLALRRA